MQVCTHVPPPVCFGNEGLFLAVLLCFIAPLLNEE